MPDSHARYRSTGSTGRRSEPITVHDSTPEGETTRWTLTRSPGAGEGWHGARPAVAQTRVAGAVARPGSHRTVRTLVVYGSSGRRVVNPAAGRLATSNHPHSASCGGSGAAMCWDAVRWRSTRKISPRLAKYALRRPWSTACVWLRAHQDLRPA